MFQRIFAYGHFLRTDPEKSTGAKEQTAANSHRADQAARKQSNLPFENRMGEIISFDDFTLDLASWELFRGEKRINLSRKPFRTLLALIRHQGQTVSRLELLRAVWSGQEKEANNLEHAIVLLRKALNDDRHNQKYVQTVYRQGYRFIAPVTLSISDIHTFPRRQVENPASAVDELSPGVPDLVEKRPVKHSSTTSNSLIEDESRGSLPGLGPEAQRAYLRGRFHWNKRSPEDLIKAVECFQTAASLAPDHAVVHVGLCDVYMILGAYGLLPAKRIFPKAKIAIRKALTLAPHLPEVHSSLAYILLAYEWDLQGALRELKVALDLNPRNPLAHFWHANCLLIAERFEEAVQEAVRALETDPVSLQIGSGVAAVLYFANRYEDSLRQCQWTLELDANYAPAHTFLGLVQIQRHKPEQATLHFQRALALAGKQSIRDAALLAYCHAACGRHKPARETLSELERRSRREYISPYYLALVCHGLRQSDRVFDFLEKAYRQRVSYLSVLHIEPIFKRLHRDSRFQKLVRKIGLQVRS